MPMPMLRTSWLLVLLAMGTAACPAGPVPEGDDDAGDDDSDVVLDPGLAGALAAVEVERLDTFEEWSPMVAGWGPMDRVPSWQRWGELWEYMGEVLLEEGECALVDSQVAAWCEGGCADDEYCGPGGVCFPWPAQLDPGALRLEGPGLSLALRLVSGLIVPDGTTPQDPFAEGDALVLDAAGAEVPPFEASATAPADLASGLACDDVLAAGQDWEVTWTPAGDGGEVVLEIIAVYHAGNGPLVRCDSPDDGSIVVPAAIGDGYLPHRTPAETTQLTRWTIGTADLGGGRSFDLRLGSQQACY